MIKIFETAAEAIEAAIERGSIERCIYSAENSDHLMAEREDGAESDEIESWGADEDGREWRVHMARA